MAPGQKDLETLFRVGTFAGMPDAALLERFVANREPAAFEAILARHGPMVFHVCRRMLSDRSDVDDAFQATFLILIQKAGAIRKRGQLGSWLHGVAHRVASRQRAQAIARRARERDLAIEPAANDSATPESRELLAALDQELARLPERLRAAVVLCDLEGKSYDEASRTLECPPGTLRSRLDLGRKRLRGRLLRRRFVPAAVISSLENLKPTARGEIPAPLHEQTLRNALAASASRTAVAAGANAVVQQLVKGVLVAMLLTRVKSIAIGLTLATPAVILAAIAPGLLRTDTQAREAQPQNQPRSPAPVAAEISPRSPRADTPAEEAQNQNDPRPLILATAKKSHFEYRTDQPGTVLPFEQADLSPPPRGTGAVTSIKASLGDRVKKGQILAELAAPEAEIELEARKVGLERARARLGILKASFQATSASVGVAAAELNEAIKAQEGAQAIRDALQKSVAANKDLLAAHRISVEAVKTEEHRLETAKVAVATADAHVATARAKLELAKARLEVAHAEVGEGETKVTSAQVAQDQAQVAYQKAIAIRSPLDGVITQVNLNVGVDVKRDKNGQPVPAFTVVRTDKMRVIVLVPDADSGRLSVGDPATLRFDSLPGREYHGAVSRSAFAQDLENRNTRCEIDLDNWDGLLRPGMWGRVVILLEKRDNVIGIPASAITEADGQGSAFCFKVVNGQAKRTYFLTGKIDQREVEVLSGINEGDTVILNPPRNLKDGDPVAPAASDKARPRP